MLGGITQLMKSQAIGSLAVLGFVFFSFSASGALAHDAVNGSPRFWTAVKELVLRCAVQPYTLQRGKKVYGRLLSTCEELQVQGAEARFVLNGDWYLAQLSDSPNSDGGDLNDVFVKDTDEKQVAVRRDIPAFGDVLLGLAGGRVQLPEQYVQDLDAQN